jgi:hypothetical protein
MPNEKIESPVGTTSKRGIRDLPVGWAILIAAIVLSLGSLHQIAGGGGNQVFKLNTLTGTVRVCDIHGCAVVRDTDKISYP